MKKRLLIAAAAAALISGCAGPNPTQFRVSLLCWYAPRVTVITAPAATNAAASADSPIARSQDTNRLSLQPSQQGVCIILDNLFAFPVGSGTAASNTVFSGWTVPLTN